MCEPAFYWKWFILTFSFCFHLTNNFIHMWWFPAFSFWYIHNLIHQANWLINGVYFIFVFAVDWQQFFFFFFRTHFFYTINFCHDRHWRNFWLIHKFSRPPSHVDRAHCKLIRFLLVYDNANSDDAYTGKMLERKREYGTAKKLFGYFLCKKVSIWCDNDELFFQSHSHKTIYICAHMRIHRRVRTLLITRMQDARADTMPIQVKVSKYWQ